MNKNLILPLEIKERELDARLLHACIALKEGWTVILGAKAYINRIVWKLPRGVYVFTTLTEKRTTTARILKRLGFRTQGWDEEGLVYPDEAVYLARRINLDTVKCIDQIFTWGKAGKETIDKKLRLAGKEAIPAGNPRVDLLRPNIRNIYRPEAEAIARKYGNYILINTNFSSVNPSVDRKSFPLKPLPKGVQDKEAERKYMEFVAYRKTMFELFQHMIPVLSETFSDVNIIIRPHPVENLAPWKKIADNHENVLVVREGPSIPWLMSATTMIHNGCTTSIESKLLGKEPIAYEPVPNTIDSPLPNAISHKARDLEDLVSLVRRCIDGKLAATAEHAAILEHHISSIHGRLSAEKLVEYAESLLAGSGQNGGIRLADKGLAYAYALLRFLYKSRRKNYKTDVYMEKVFPETSPKEIIEKVQHLMTILYGREADPETISAEVLHRNVFKLQWNGSQGQ